MKKTHTTGSLTNRAVRIVCPFSKKKKKEKKNQKDKKKKTPHTWILSKLSATMEIENYLGEKTLHCVY